MGLGGVVGGGEWLNGGKGLAGKPLGVGWVEVGGCMLSSKEAGFSETSCCLLN